MAIKGVLFDKDGTLIDDAGTWAPSYLEILEDHFPGEAVERFARAGYDPATRRFVSGSVVAGGTTREIAEVFWPGSDGAALDEKVRLIDVGYRHLPLKHLTTFMPLEPVLEGLRAMGLRLGIATNDNAASTALHVERLGVGRFFDMLIASDSVARPKPAGDMIRAFAARMGIAPAEIAMVGDNPHDMLEARNGGAGLAVAVASGASSRADIAHLADHVIDDAGGLEALLKTL